ncbi:MAG: T9SS type A sorting domain-containing protein [Bacteroidales bacterium]|nr:T9SS type A sorting domain-containing protein [Bacteroidales bacterium]
MKNVVFPFLLLISIITNSQFINIEWQQCYGGSGGDNGKDVVISNNGYAVFCATGSNDGQVSYNHGSNDFWLIFTDQVGNLLWEKTYGGSDIEFPYKLERTADGNYIMFGYTLSNDGDITNNHGSQDYWVVKADSIGEIIWQKCLWGSWPEYGLDMDLDQDENIVVIGYSYSNDGNITNHIGHYDYWIVKLNQQGEILWDKSLGGTFMDWGLCISPTNDGGYITGGFTLSDDIDVVCDNHETEHGDTWIVKLDSLGNIEWQNCYGGTYFENAIEILQIEDGYIFVGGTNSNDGDVSGFHGTPGTYDNYDIWVVKLDESGNIEWQRCLGGTDTEHPKFIIETEENGYLVGGWTMSHDGDVIGNHSIGDYRADIWLVKLSEDGAIEWQQCIGNSNNQQFGNILKLSENNYILIGGTGAIDISGDVDCDYHGGGDVWMFKISDTTTGVNELQSTDEIVKVYPNPAKDYVVFELPPSVISNQWAGQSASVRNPLPVRVTNLFGQEVTKLPVKIEKTVWDTREVKNGIYFYSVEIEGKYFGGKVVIQK